MEADVYIFGIVIPADGEAVEQCGAPILGDSVELTKGPQEMLSMFVADVLDAEVVNHEGESDGTSDVGSKGGGAGGGAVTKFGEVKGEVVVGDTTGLYESWHPLPDLHVDPAVGCGKGCQVVLLDDFSRNFGDVKLHVFVAVHWRSVVNILDIKRAEACAGGGYGAVEENFNGSEACSLGGRGAREIKTVAAGAVADTVGFGLVGVDCRFLLAISDFSAGWYIPSLE
jgi:hypothetical protein